MMSRRPHDDVPIVLTVGELLEPPVLAGAPLLAGSSGLGRAIAWTAVIEGQPVGLLQASELALLSLDRAA